MSGRWISELKSPLGFTGIDSPYEPPLNPECVVKSGEDSIDTCVKKVIKTLDDNGVLKGKLSTQLSSL
jgi:adenylylsulfate kinase-like enzyme